MKENLGICVFKVKKKNTFSYQQHRQYFYLVSHRNGSQRSHTSLDAESLEINKLLFNQYV